jgi:hypothetical protein
MLVICVGLVAIAAAALLVVRRMRTHTVQQMIGAIVAQNENPYLQRPIGGVVIHARSEEGEVKTTSETSGFFRLHFAPPVTAGSSVMIAVKHPDYNAYTGTMLAGDQISVIRLTPTARQPATAPVGQEIRIANIRVRYATLSTSTSTVGSAVRTFDIVNTGNVPCPGKEPCSPDRKWKAAVQSLTLETGEKDKHFRNVRVSCIAGPCPFSSIDRDRFSRGGKTISVSVRNWSDTVTYLVEAEVAMTMESELIRYAYPMTFGRAMNFTVPAAASGLSIEAEVGGSEIVFPLGPEMRLSWAACRLQSGPEGSKQYRCELKPGYRFE